MDDENCHEVKHAQEILHTFFVETIIFILVVYRGQNTQFIAQNTKLKIFSELEIFHFTPVK